MLNISKLKILKEKKHLQFRTLCTGVNYDVILDRIRKNNELRVDEAEILQTNLQKIVDDVKAALE